MRIEVLYYYYYIVTFLQSQLDIPFKVRAGHIGRTVKTVPTEVPRICLGNIFPFFLFRQGGWS